MRSLTLPKSYLNHKKEEEERSQPLKAMPGQDGSAMETMWEPVQLLDSGYRLR